MCVSDQVSSRFDTKWFRARNTESLLLISARNTWITSIYYFLKVAVNCIFYCGLRSTSENLRTFRTDKMPTKKRQRKNSVHISCPRINFHGGQSISSYLYIKFDHGIVEHTTLTVTFRRLKTARVTEVCCSPMSASISFDVLDEKRLLTIEFLDHILT